MPTSRVWRLTQRPDGEITDGVLSLEEASIPEPADGQFLLRLTYLSLDPTNRGWMNPEPTYLPPVALGDPMRGIVCGTVTESRHPDFATGDIVSGIGQWAEYQIGTPDTLNKLDPGPLPLADAFGLFAVVGPTAYFGLLDIGQPPASGTSARTVSTSISTTWEVRFSTPRSVCSISTGGFRSADPSRGTTRRSGCPVRTTTRTSC